MWNSIIMNYIIDMWIIVRPVRAARYWVKWRQRCDVRPMGAIPPLTSWKKMLANKKHVFYEENVFRGLGHISK